MICGYAEVMRDLPGENTPENIQVIIDEATRLTNLVNDVLDISKLESGTQKLEKSEFSLTDEIRETTKRYRKLTDCTLTFESDRNVFIFADELKISQVIYNLINNAINYTGTDRKIQIRQLVRDHQVTVEVTDTGEGIPADKLHDIWDRYYKVDKEHKRAQIGTGLGLSIVKSILDMHGGFYGVRSAVGVGSTFWFRLPILSESPVGALPEETHHPDSDSPQS
ncbi:MAG: HAMP domain-containing histidine kinase, partial [Oscillospiraceae bacterium]|jgi:signal transduction histidine kinase|nr:HAMP domain-containing histidine kinase [Oscillospiraceae bacterium]